MKKLAVVLIIIFVSVSAVAEEPSTLFQLPTDWLVAEFAFQVGWIPNGNIEFLNPSELPAKTLLTSFDAVFEIDTTVYKLIKLGGQCITLFSLAGADSTALLNFRPTGMTYLFYVGIEPIKNIVFKYEHSCSHPVSWFLPISESAQYLFSEYDRISFEISGKIQF